MLRFYSVNTSDKVSGQIFCIQSGVRHSSDTCRQICLQIESMIVIAKRANGMYKTKFSVRIDNVLLFSFMWELVVAKEENQHVFYSLGCSKLSKQLKHVTSTWEELSLAECLISEKSFSGKCGRSGLSDWWYFWYPTLVFELKTNAYLRTYLVRKFILSINRRGYSGGQDSALYHKTAKEDKTDFLICTPKR